MQAQTTQIVQAAAMTAKDWYPILIGAASAILAAIGAVILTLAWQARKEKRDLKMRLFFTLMTHRKSDPPHFEWVHAVNMIDVIFADKEDVVAAWRALWNILNDKEKVGSQAHQHANLHMLSTMAQSLGFKKLQQIDIDKFYSPQAYVNQAAAAQEIQNLARAFFENVNKLITAPTMPQVLPPQVHPPRMPPPEFRAPR